MKSIIIMICGIFLTLTAFSEEFTWEEVPTPEGGELNVVVLDSNGTFWGVTPKYTIYYREAGADAWVEKETNTETSPINNGFVTSGGDICFNSDNKLLVSTDNGNNWELKEFPDDISCIRCNINNILYIELFTILYRSTDLGSNWEHVYGDDGFFMSDQATSISVTPYGDYAEFHPANGEVQYVKSTDNGESWFEITDTLPGLNDISGIGDTEYHRDGYMVVGTISRDSDGNYLLTLFASDNEDAAWKPIAESKFDTTITDGASISSHYFLYSGKLIKWNKSDDFPGVTVFDDSYTIEEYFYMVPSEDFYALEEETNISVPDNNGIYSIRVSSLETGSGDNLFTSSDGGIYKLNPADDSWEFWEVNNDGYNYSFIGATKNDDYLIYKRDSKSLILVNGDGHNVIRDSISDYSVNPYFGNDVLIYTSYGRHYISYDYGGAVNEISSDGIWNTDGYGYVTVSDFLIGKGDTHYRISKFHKETGENSYASANSFMSRTTDRGQSWEEIINANIEFDKDTSINSIIPLYGAVSPQGLLYYATHYSFADVPLKVSNDNGDNFTDCIQGINEDEYYRNMYFSPTNDYTLLRTDKNLYLSKDSYTWELITPDIEYEVSNACFTSDGIIYVLDSYGNLFKSNNPVSVEENNYVNSPQIYPNPTDNVLYINFGTEYSGTAKVKLISITGITVLEKGYTNSQQPLRLDVSGFQTGVYIISVSNGSELFNRKVIIE